MTSVETPAKPAAATADPTKAADKTPKSSPFTVVPLGGGQKYLKLIVYGNFGVGKSTLAASAADVEEMADVFYIDAESGKMALEDSPRIENKDRIFVARATNFTQVARMHEFLKVHCRFRDANDIEALKNLEARVFGVPVESIDEPKRFNTVVVDSFTEVDTYSMYDLLDVSTDAKLDAEVDVAEWPTFRKNNQRMMMLARAFRDLPMNLILVCSTQYTQDESKRMFWTPALTGKLSAQVQGLVDIVGYLVTGSLGEGKEEAPRRLWLQPVGKFDAKNRKGYLKAAYLDDPSLPNLMEQLAIAKQKMDKQAKK